MLDVTLYNQADPKWGKKLMKPSTETLARFGCLVSAIAGGLKNYGIAVDPGVLCDKLIQFKGFDEWGNLLHDSIPKLYPQVSFIERVYTTNNLNPAVAKLEAATAMARVKQLLRYGQPVYLEVDNIYNDDKPDHWVLCYEKTSGPFGLDFSVYNPDGGRSHKFSDVYGDPMTNIFGYYSLVGPPIYFPADGTPNLGQVFYKLSRAKKGENVSLNVKEAFGVMYE